MFFSFPLNQLSKTSVLLCSSSTRSLVSSCSLSYLILCLLGVSARGPGANGQSSAPSEKAASEVRFRLSHFKWERFVHPHQRDTAFLFDFISYKCQRGNNGPDSCMANCWALISLAEQGVQLAEELPFRELSEPVMQQVPNSRCKSKEHAIPIQVHLSEERGGVVGNGIVKQGEERECA